MDEKVYEIVNSNFQNTSQKPKEINQTASTSIKNQSISNSDFSKQSNLKDKQIHRTQSNGINVVKFESRQFDRTDKEMKLYSMQQLKHNIDLVIHGYLLKVINFNQS